MVKIRAFQGYVANEKHAFDIISPPYDVISRSEAKIYAEGNEFSFLHVNKPEIDLKDSIDQYDDQVYLKGKENLEKFVVNNLLVQEKEKILYIYSQKMKGKTQYGIMCETSVEEYENDLIKKHEQTRPKKEKDRTKLTEVQNANIGPIFLAYKEKEEINILVEQVIKNKPYFDFEKEDKIQHTIWKCSVEESKKLEDLFKGVDYFYIADGHHRAASAYNVAKMKRDFAKQQGTILSGNEDFFYFLSIIYPSSQLTIFDYNRVLKSKNDKTTAEILNEIKLNFIVDKAFDKIEAKPKKKGDFGFYIDNEWYKLTFKGEIVDKDPVKILDVQILTDFVLKAIFNIVNIREDERIDFVGGIRNLEELEKRCNDDCVCAFAVFPINFDEVINVANKNLNMPPKSTWFEPKPRSGCVVRIMEN